MEHIGPEAWARRLPEFVALFQAVEALHLRLRETQSATYLPAAAVTSDVATTQLGTESICECRFSATFFGRFTFYRDGQAIALGQHWSCLELCRYLIAQRDRLVPRDELLELLWPDATDSRSSLHRLHVAVSNLRRLVDPVGAVKSLIQLEGDSYHVPAHMIDTDFSLFDQSYGAAKRHLARGDLAGAAEDFRVALAMYRGDFLNDHLYAEWTHLLRNHFRERRLVALAVLCESAERERNYRAVLDFAGEILETDNLREMAHRQIMRAHYFLGERGLAIRQYELCERMLRIELGVEPSRQSRHLHQAICDDRELPAEISSIP